LDNASTDDTARIILELQDKFDFAYERNEFNIGAANNFAKAISSSTAEWVWLLGDDDHIISHSLGHLLDALHCLDLNVAFVRCLAAQVDKNGAIRYFEPVKDSSFVLHHNPGILIAECGHVHSLACISQLLFRPRYWDNDYYRMIFKWTDQYTHALTVMHICKTKKAAEILLHITAFTDRGERKYNDLMCVAVVSESFSFERILVQELGKSKSKFLLMRGRKNTFRRRLECALKLGAFRDTIYKEQEDLLSKPQAIFIEDMILIRLVDAFTRRSFVRRMLRAYYKKVTGKSPVLPTQE